MVEQNHVAEQHFLKLVVEFFNEIGRMYQKCDNIYRYQAMIIFFACFLGLIGFI